MQALCLSAWGGEARMEVVTTTGLGTEAGIMGHKSCTKARGGRTPAELSTSTRED